MLVLLLCCRDLVLLKPPVVSWTEQRRGSMWINMANRTEINCTGRLQTDFSAIPWHHKCMRCPQTYFHHHGCPSACREASLEAQRQPALQPQPIDLGFSLMEADLQGGGKEKKQNIHHRYSIKRPNQQAVAEYIIHQGTTGSGGCEQKSSGDDSKKLHSSFERRRPNRSSVSTHSYHRD